MLGWDDAVLQDGKYTGSEHGYKYSEGNYLNCGISYMLVMDGNQTEPTFSTNLCPDDIEPGTNTCIPTEIRPDGIPQ